MRIRSIVYHAASVCHRGNCRLRRLREEDESPFKGIANDPRIKGRLSGRTLQLLII